jgi:ABC-type amino acid transport substrate-binding protein
MLLVIPGHSTAEELRIDTIQMPPFGFVTKDGQNTGLLYDISNRIAEETGLPYTNQIVPFARMVGELERGDADFSMFYRSTKNDQITIPVAALVPIKNIVIGVKGTQFDSLESLHGKLVARVRGARYDEAFNQDDAIQKFDTIDYAQGITMLMNKRVDACIGPEIGLLFTAKQLGYAREDFGEPLVLNTKDLWVQYSKAAADDEKIAALKAAIDKLMQDGTIQALVDKYFEE